MILVGIDEAGYGPLLGPLVASAVAFEVPDARVHDSLWKILRASVTNRVRPRDGRLVVTDSKRLSSRPDCMARLERPVLAALSTRPSWPRSLSEFLSECAVHAVPAIERCPWYREADLVLPVANPPEVLATAATAFRHDMQGHRIAFLGAWSELLTAAEYNRTVEKTRNKAVVLFTLTIRLIQRIADTHPGRTLRILVDRQGGRQAYRPALMRAFEVPALTVLEESPGRSAYALRNRPADCSIEFLRHGEDAQLPIALASIFSKYQRELFMRLFNAFFLARCPGLRPTAGYYKDARRFLADIHDDLGRLGIDTASLVRVI